MFIEKPSYIVIEFSGQVAEWVNEVRCQYEPAISHMPVEITVAGSSGCGPIKTGQSLESVISVAESIVPLVKNQQVGFVKVSNFEGSPIYFLEPERELFDEIHQQLVNSALAFEDTPFPYNPHISLKGFTPPSETEIKDLLGLPVPQGAQPLHKLSIVEMDGMTPNTLWSVALS